MKLLSKISLRTVIQLAIVVLIFSLAIIHRNFGVEKAAPIDAYCPFGAVESFFTLIFKGEFLKRIFTSSFILLGIFLVATLLLGRVFCGYFCPLGAIQEWLRAIGKKLGFKKDLELPEKADKYLRYVKYLVLAVIVYFSFYLGDLIFRLYDPYNALMHFGAEFEEKIVGYILLGLVVVAALFSKSLWCRYFCPLGAFFGVIKKISFLKIKRDGKTCTSCGLCDRIFPANLKIKTAETIKDADCISCGKCISNCPPHSLNYVIFNKPISKKLFSILVIVLVVLPLVIAPYTSFWKTKPESNITSICLNKTDLFKTLTI
jgi:NapH/MauN family ferredoxin-type protein